MPVLPGLRHPGDGLSHAPGPKGGDAEAQRCAHEELVSRAKEVYPSLVHSSRMLYTVSVIA